MTKTDRLAAIDQIIADIHAMMNKPALRELTSRETETRADRLRSYANGVKLAGGEVKQEYQ